MDHSTFRSSLRLAAALLLTGQLLYIAVTQLHTGGDANDHASIFAAYADSKVWTVVHLAQFVATAILLAGLLALRVALDARGEPPSWTGRFGAAAAVAALALFAALQAVDGIANKQADLAWLNAPEAEKAARFASAEAVRWIEWGLRSYFDIVLGIALLLFAVALARADQLPQGIAWLMGLDGFSYMAQGWVVGVEGFSQTESLTIVLSWVLSLVWMIWLAIAARRLPAR